RPARTARSAPDRRPRLPPPHDSAASSAGAAANGLPRAGSLSAITPCHGDIPINRYVLRAAAVYMPDSNGQCRALAWRRLMLSAGGEAAAHDRGLVGDGESQDVVWRRHGGLRRLDGRRGHEYTSSRHRGPTMQPNPGSGQPPGELNPAPRIGRVHEPG